MTITEIRALTGLPMSKFAQKYEIPYRTLQKWEFSKDNPNYRECPIYVNHMLERLVKSDFCK